MWCRVGAKAPLTGPESTWKRSSANVLTKTISTIAFVASISLAGLAMATEDFSTLADVSAEPMTAAEMQATQGQSNIRVVAPGGGTNRTIINGRADGGAAHEAVYATQNGQYTIQFQ